MADRAALIARIRLSRSIPRLLALPALAFGAGAGLSLGGLLLVPGIPGLVLGIAGVAIGLLAVAASIVLLSIRLDIEEYAVRVRWIGGERLYGFSPGPITRVRLRGEDASRLRASRPRIGWALGPALLRDEEPIEVVRLAPTSTAILVPTERGRLAIGAADEGELLDALSRAARARQRLDVAPEEPQPELAAPAPEPEGPGEPVEVAAPIMTGIERAQHEQWLAEEQARVEAAAADRVAALAASEALAASAAQPITDRDGHPAPAPAQPRPSGRRRRWPIARGWRPSGPIASRAPSIGLAVLPLVGAGAAWGLGLASDRMPAPGSDLGRLTALALVLAGPATTVGAIMARAWWPRLVGVVVVGGLAASVFVGRALVGG